LQKTFEAPNVTGPYHRLPEFRAGGLLSMHQRQIHVI
jgi:hypothetical protein